MEQKDIIKAVKQARESKKRNFKQGFDLIINLKNIDLKKQDNQIDLYVMVKHPPKKKKICALIGAELKDEASKVCDLAILSDSFPEYSEKKKARQLAQDHDYFIAQANVMPKVANIFGRVFGVRGKMPNPKAGCVVPPKANLGPLYEKLQNTIRVTAKSAPIVQCGLGNEEMKDEDLADNVHTIYNAVLHKLPNERNNIKSVFVKFTMGKPAPVKF
ncbi:50S ribosomal protein L1 [Candidatus Woesearchaeota archaeon]|nr:50S ribosomal protein L1 [Candidatus Woesearchaeota archaeon]